MTPHRFIITGMPHQATLWLAQMLNQHPKAKVSHETFCVGYSRFPADLRKWMHIDSPVVGSANSRAIEFYPEIEAACHPQWVVLWRNPLDVMRTDITTLPSPHLRATYNMLNRDYFLIGRAWERYYLLDCALRKMNTLPPTRRPTHWLFKHYITKDGFEALAKCVGLDFAGIDYKWLEPAHAHNMHTLPPPEHWDVQVRKAVKAALFRREACAKGFAAAEARAKGR